MTPKLYMTEVSPAVRAVLMTAKILKITLDLKDVNLQDKEQLSPKFLKLNPQHTFPTLEDNGLIIWDSHAIIAYLAGKYGVYDNLYPKDIQKRAIIDQRLHFDSGVVSHILKTVMNPIIYGECVEVPQDFNEKIVHIYDFVETFLEEGWIAGKSLSIADFSLLASVTTLNVIWSIDFSKYPRMRRWIEKSEREPFYGGNRGGLDKLEYIIRFRQCME